MQQPCPHTAGAFKFGIKRGGLLYGNTDEAGNVAVDFIYEPPQEGTPETLKLHRGGEEEAMVSMVAHTVRIQALACRILDAFVLLFRMKWLCRDARW